MTYFSREPPQGHGNESRRDPNLDECASDALGTAKSLDASALYPKCALCEGYIQNIVVQALDKTWHPEHFRCSHCHVPISTQKFHVHQDNPYCVEDYATLFLKKCQGCKLPIKDVVVTALNQTWHQDHFVCISCGCKLLNKGFYEKEDNAFCTECFEGKFCPKCCECGAPITDTAVKINTRRWHESCFKCGHCGRLMTGAPFRVCGEDVLCVPCAGNDRRNRGEVSRIGPCVEDGGGERGEIRDKRRECFPELQGIRGDRGKIGHTEGLRGNSHDREKIRHTEGLRGIIDDRGKIGHTEGLRGTARRDTREDTGILARMAEYIGRMEKDMNSGGATTGHWRGIARDPRPMEGRGELVKYFEGSDEEINLA